MYEEAREPRIGEKPSSSQMDILNLLFSKQLNEALTNCIEEIPATDPQHDKWEFEINNINSPEIFDKQLNKNWFIQDSGFELINSRLYYLMFTRQITHPEYKPVDLFLISENKNGKIIDIRKINMDYDSYECLIDNDSERWDLLMPLLGEIQQGACDTTTVQELTNILKNSKYKLSINK